MAAQTQSEQYLARLCQRSFLSLWSYPNPYTDKGKQGGECHGRELCDLLVVFGDSVIIFSDKHVKYKDTGNASIDWGRWHRGAVEASIRQLYGAESWLKRYPNRVYLDPLCSKPLPVKLPDPERAHFHRIAVTRGSYDACVRFFGGKSLGSLRLTNRLSDIGKAPQMKPFTVGSISLDKPFVHVFDEFILDVVMNELDTVSDFVSYLTKKERFLTQTSRLILADGEEQLLSLYMTKINSQGEHDIVLPEGTTSEVDFVWLNEGIWEGMIKNPQYRAKKEADQVSYFWDQLTERFIQLSDPKYLGLGLELEQPPEGMELAFRIMASESRVSRRNLAHSILDVRGRSGPKKAYSRLVTSVQSPDTVYIFLAVPKIETESYLKYRQYRTARLMAYCKVAKLVAPEAKHVVGIAFDSHDPEHPGVSEDLCYLDVSEWTEEMEREARELQAQFGILLGQNVTSFHYHDSEWPEPQRPVRPSTSAIGTGFSREQRRKLAGEKQKTKKRKSMTAKKSKARNRLKK